ncbi:MAG TPA: helix-turn-helix domain-containing protein, partial [Candidatus Paceibacterota bacterium]|nr:helix-turn-helix domain-containing protein [Candidatus Paceibacterota bacterium]
MDLEQEKANNYISLSDLAAKYGYTEYHIRRLARSGRIQAVRYGTKGEWRVDEKSLEKYHQETTQRRFSELKKEQIASTVLSEGSLNAEPRNTSLTSAPRIAESRSKLIYGAETRHRGTNAIPKKFLLLVGGILFLINFIPAIETIDLNLNKTPIAKQYSQIKESVSADILEPVRNFVRKYLLPDYGQETYLVIDPYKLREEKIKEQGERISALENQIFNFQFSIFNQAPISNDQTKKTTIIKEVTVGPSGTTLTLLEQRLDNTVSLIEATRI